MSNEDLAIEKQAEYREIHKDYLGYYPEEGVIITPSEAMYMKHQLQRAEELEYRDRYCS